MCYYLKKSLPYIVRFIYQIVRLGAYEFLGGESVRFACLMSHRKKMPVDPVIHIKIQQIIPQISITKASLSLPAVIQMSEIRNKSAISRELKNKRRRESDKLPKTYR